LNDWPLSLQYVRSTPFHLALAYWEEDPMDVTSVLLTSGAQIEARDRVCVDLLNRRLTCPQKGWTPLHLACYHGQVKIVDDLLARGAYIRARDEVSWTWTRSVFNVST
jgi:hypothetical protein